jgi:hypothetical protein
LVGLEPPPRVSCPMLFATAVPSFSFPSTAYSLTRERRRRRPSLINRRKSLQNPLPTRAKRKPPDPSGWGAKGGRFLLQVGFWIDPCKGGCRKGFSGMRSGCDLLKRKDMVGWLESPHVFRLTKLSYSVCNSHARSGPMREEAAGMGVFRFLASCAGGSRNVPKGGEGFLSYNGPPGTLPFLHSASL